VYLETTFVSYLAARPSRDLIQAAHQQITWEWWEARRRDFELYISQLVVREASAGDPEQAARRLEFVKGIPLLDVNDAAIDLAASLVADGPLPRRAADDALHIAVATIHGMDYLLTWNCKHLANAETVMAVNTLLTRKGFAPPVICVPEELLGTDDAR
jgi:predicted nucleic acid-binding protein